MSNKGINLRDTFYPSCPYNNSIIILITRIIVMVFGTFGIYFFNPIIAGLYLLYSLVYNVGIWPIKHCRYCYYKIKQCDFDNKETNANNGFLPIEDWKEKFLTRHVECGKKWGSPNLMLLWLSPIGFIILSLLTSFSPLALMVLLGFIGSLVFFGIYMRRTVCETCAFMEECHAAF